MAGHWQVCCLKGYNLIWTTYLPLPVPTPNAPTGQSYRGIFNALFLNIRFKGIDYEQYS